MINNIMKPQVVRSRAPLRIGIAGGGTDVSPFSDHYGGVILNATIGLYAQCIFDAFNDAGGYVEFVASDIGKSVRYKADINQVPTSQLPLHCALLNYMRRNYRVDVGNGFKMTTYADAPVGSGLGTSSTIVVSMVEAYNKMFNLNIPKSEIARIAYCVERIDLGFKGGKQDQYAAAFGGVNCMIFGPGDQVKVEPVRVDDAFMNELESSTILFYSGQSRDSGAIIEHQVKKAADRESDAFKAMLALKDDASRMVDAFVSSDLNRYSIILRESWENKKRLSNVVSNPHLDKIYDAAMSAGAKAGKISGAGGGGFFMFFVPPEYRNDVIRCLSGFDGSQIGFVFTKLGVTSWIC
jgi:D-glycero-alpha-D-manno-heptose-7-phosphate kinase